MTAAESMRNSAAMHSGGVQPPPPGGGSSSRLPESAHLGSVVLCGVELRLDWAALSALQTEFGEDWDTQVQKAFADFDVSGMARALACCSGLASAEWTALSPPLVESSRAFSRALNYAFYGVHEPSEVAHDSESPRPSTWLERLLGSGAKLAGTREPSGG